MSLPPHVQRGVEERLNAIAGFWKPGAKLTLLVRFDTPDRPGAWDALFTSDDLDAVIEAIARRKAAGQDGDTAHG